MKMVLSCHVVCNGIMPLLFNEKDLTSFNFGTFLNQLGNRVSWVQELVLNCSSDHEGKLTSHKEFIDLKKAFDWCTVLDLNL